MHASLNEDLIQPKKLEMGISHRTGGRTGHFDWGRHETTPGWSANRKLRSGKNRQVFTASISAPSGVQTESVPGAWAPNRS
jgi:hypothetical protein